ncbi:MAG: hypothetical protein ABH954_04120 [Candidatus Omnitrophota bacterium]
MKHDTEGNPIYTLGELQHRMSKLIGNILIPCTAVLVYGIVRLVKFQIGDLQGLIMTLGAILSTIGSFTYSLVLLVYRKEKTWRSSFFTFLAVLPFLFGCFLVLYKGFWSFKYLFNSFSIWGLLVPIVWILLGYRIVSQLHIMTEIDNLIGEGKMKVEKENE